MSFLLTTGIIRGSEDLSEILSYKRPKQFCRPLKNPLNVFGATGKYPLICGGKTLNNSITNLCYSFSNDSSPISMTMARAFASSLLFNNSLLWVTGGEIKNESLTNSTEFINSKISIPGPDLPMELKLHCLVKLSETQALLIGGSGKNDAVQNGTFLYDFSDETWIEGPQMLQPRIGHNCAKLGPLIVVVGSIENEIASKSVEIMDLQEQNKKWIQGPQVPIQTIGTSAVSLGMKLFLFSETATFVLNCEENCFWKWARNRSPKISRSYGLALIIPQNMTQCF